MEGRSASTAAITRQRIVEQQLAVMRSQLGVLRQRTGRQAPAPPPGRNAELDRNGELGGNGQPGRNSALGRNGELGGEGQPSQPGRNSALGRNGELGGEGQPSQPGRNGQLGQLGQLGRTGQLGPEGAEPIARAMTISEREAWLTAQSEPDAAIAHAGIGVWRLRGSVRPDLLWQALCTVSERHEALRSLSDPDGERQLVHPEAAVDWRERSDAAASNAEPNAEPDADKGGETNAADAPGPALGWISTELRAPMDLSAGPLVRGRLVRVSDDSHLFGVAFAPTAVDGWSFGVLVDEIAQLYNAWCADTLPALPPAPPYAAYLEWERFGSQHARTYWAERFGTQPPALALPYRSAVSSDDLDGDTRRVRIEAELYARLGATADSCGSTMFQLMLAAYTAFLHRVTGESDVVVGVPNAGQAMAGVPGLVGQCLRTLPLRSRTHAGQSFRELLAELRLDLLEGQENGAYSLGELLADTAVRRDEWGMGLISTVFNIDRPGALELSGLRTEPVELSEQSATFDAAINIREEAGAATVEWTYRRALFSPDAVDRLAESFVRVLAAVAQDPDRAVDSLPLRSDDKRRDERDDWPIGAPAEPVDLTDCVHRLFGRRAAEQPEAIAVVAEDGTLGYRDLDARSDALAAHLGSLGVGVDQVVGVCLPRSVQLVVAVLGILKAGAAYLPLDPVYPAERLQFMADDAALSYVLSRRDTAERVPRFAGETIWLDDEEPWWREAERARGTNGSAVPVRPRNLAYLTYTSGSTGRPKGVAVEHAGLANRIRWMQRTYRLGATDVVLQKTPLSFDVSGWELFWPLTQGARMVLAAPGGQRDADYLSELIESEGVTVLHFVPSMLAEFMRTEQVAARFSGVRQVFCSGEALSAELADRFFELFDCELHNLYGPTEASIDATFWRCEPGTAPVIGRPITGMSSYVLDDALAPVPVGATGELYLGGIGLARGYRGRGGLTAQRFVPDRFGPPGGRLYRTGDLARWREDGTLEFLGRTDDQVKVRGFRIELGEVEWALRQQPGVGEAVVVLRDERLLGYVVPRAGASIDTRALRESLGGSLPPFMVPALLVALERFPLLPNGKVDRSALPAEVAQPAEREPGTDTAPRTELEKTVAEIWAEVLGLAGAGARAPGIHDNFFDLGGDSIRALRIQSAARARGLRITMRLLFRNPTVAELAASLEGGGGQDGARGPSSSGRGGRAAARDTKATPATYAPAGEQQQASGTAARQQQPASGTAARQQRARPQAGEQEASMPAAGEPAAAHSDTFGLTPIQHWFFDRALSEPSHWNHATLVSLSEPVGDEVMDRAVRAVARTHRSLRARFVRAGKGWRQWVANDDRIYHSVDLSGSPATDRAARLRAEKDRWQRGLDIEHGPVAAFVRFRLGEAEPDQLLLLAHHLVTDVVSWQVVLADLAVAVRRASDEAAEISLPEPETSYRDWAQLLADAAKRPELATERSSWTELLSRGRAVLPVERPDGPNLERNAARVLLALDPARTERLLGGGRHVRPDRLVLASVASALCEWAQASPILVDVEGHGRYDLGRDIDLSRTVGWFTSIAPVLLDNGISTSTGEALRRVAERLDAMPDGGLGFGLLRYLDEDPRAVAAFRDLPRSEVLFNYLGSHDRTSDDGSLFGRVTDTAGSWRAASSARSHLLEVNAWVGDGRLTLHWTYSTEQFDAATIERVAARALELIGTMVDDAVPPR